MSDLNIEKCKIGFNYLINIPLYHLSEDKKRWLLFRIILSNTREQNCKCKY